MAYRVLFRATGMVIWLVFFSFLFWGMERIRAEIGNCRCQWLRDAICAGDSAKQVLVSDDTEGLCCCFDSVERSGGTFF